MKLFTKLVHAGLYLAFSCLLAACSGGGGASTTPQVTPTLALFAGNMGGAGDNDGPVATARFTSPNSVATDSSGNIYVTETFFHSIRKITPDGVVSTLAGSRVVHGSADGIGAAARFYFPSGVATDGAGNIYVADTGNFTIRKITPEGMVSTLAGTPGVPGSVDGTAAAARFSLLNGIATDSAGNVYVTDGHTIRKIMPTGMVSTLAGSPGVSGSADGIGTAASFSTLHCVATDSAGNVFVADSGNHTIRKITPDGVVSTLAGTPGVPGNADGSGAAASFFSPFGVATDSADNVYVADTGNYLVRKITPSGEVSTLAGSPGVIGSADGIGAAASFNYPQGVATDSAGNVYVADFKNQAIRKITPNGVVSTLAGISTVTGSADGAGAAATFSTPSGIAADSTGNVYVADTWNHTIRKITPNGVVSTLAGTPGVIGSADGIGAAASFAYPSDVATDGVGNVYVADLANDTIRKITPGGLVSTLAGTPGVVGSADGIGAAASFNAPLAVASDISGNVFVADSGNHTIRKITPSGVVSTLAGTPGVSGITDGTGASAHFYSLFGIATDSAGNVYVADYHIIRKITPTGIVSTLAGIPGVSGSTDGTGATASFSITAGVTTDSAGNVYVADNGNNTIRKITPSGVVSTVVGVAGVGGFTPGPLPGALSSPRGIAISGTSLYITMYNGVAVVNNVP